MTQHLRAETKSRTSGFSSWLTKHQAGFWIFCRKYLPRWHHFRLTDRQAGSSSTIISQNSAAKVSTDDTDILLLIMLTPTNGSEIFSRSHHQIFSVPPQFENKALSVFITSLWHSVHWGWQGYSHRGYSGYLFRISLFSLWPARQIRGENGDDEGSQVAGPGKTEDMFRW